MGHARRGTLRRLLGAVAGAMALLVGACQGRAPKTAETPGDAATAAPADTAAGLPPALAIARHAEELMSIPGVVGVYEGETGGQPVLRVMVLARADSIVRRVPKTLEGYPVEIEVSGPIKPMSK